MKRAVRVFSRAGLFKTPVDAWDITSSEHARKLWPFVTPPEEGPRQFVTWVRSSFDQKTGYRQRQRHFRRLGNGKSKNIQHFFEVQKEDWAKKRAETSEHKRAKELITNELLRRLDSGEGLLWSYMDKTSSDFAFYGDLLLNADVVKPEVRIKTPYDTDYRLDIAILGGNPLGSTPLLLGGIEIEFEHAFNGCKALLCRTLAFPLISIDISGMTIEELTKDWAKSVLSLTTIDDAQNRRKTFVYLHDLIYPQFSSFPSHGADRKHQFIIFAPTETLSKLTNRLTQIRDKLGYKAKDAAISPVNAKSQQAATQISRLGEVVGEDWKEYNSTKCLLLTMDRPDGPHDKERHLFHTLVLKLLLREEGCLIGYKFRPNITNFDLSEDCWLGGDWDAEKKQFSKKLLPKRLSVPVSTILAVMKNIEMTASSSTVDDQ